MFFFGRTILSNIIAHTKDSGVVTSAHVINCRVIIMPNNAAVIPNVMLPSLPIIKAVMQKIVLKMRATQQFATVDLLRLTDTIYD